jgi:hypothetical protein
LNLPVLERTESEANVLRVKVPKLQDKQHTTETILIKVHGTKLLASSQPQAKINSKQRVSRDKKGKSLLNEQVIAQCQNKTQQQIVTNLEKLREGPNPFSDHPHVLTGHWFYHCLFSDHPHVLTGHWFYH